MVEIAPAPEDFSDWEDLLALLRGAFADMEGRIDPPSSLNRLDAESLRAKARHDTLLLAMDGERLVGCVFLKDAERSLYISKLAVDEAFRNRGIARRLLDRAESTARDRRYEALELETRIELTENHRSFASLGFHKIRETAHPGFGRPTSITMRKPVSPRP